MHTYPTNPTNPTNPTTINSGELTDKKHALQLSLPVTVNVVSYYLFDNGVNHHAASDTKQTWNMAFPGYHSQASLQWEL